ncbi:MAG TPA: trypsin-like peptidase domain-containing protein [Nitrospiria bacterium]|nr:trypsin-like peptidase domain-containing protein [Nitrospiria bacterium]
MICRELMAARARDRSPLQSALFLGLVLGAASGGVTGCRYAADPPRDQPPGPEAAATSVYHPAGDRPAIPAVGELIPRHRFAQIAKSVAPAVVHLKTVQELREEGSLFHRSPGRAFLRHFFKNLLGLSREVVLKQEGVGSGFIVDPAGYVLTNFHVVKHAVEIRAVLSDEREMPARVVGQDARVDLALLRLEGEGPFPAAVLGDSARLESGEWAMAAGSPLGLAQTFTVGVISATGRSHLGITSRENFIQTDASINYGNSGGPLLNINAEVVGINTAIMPTGHGIGFAIPINMAREFIGEVLKSPPVQRAWLGIEARMPVPGRGDRDGVVLQSVQWPSPAWRSGLRAADRIIRLDDRELGDVAQLQRSIVKGGIGIERRLTVERGGVIKEIRVRPEEWPMRIFP